MNHKNMYQVVIKDQGGYTSISYHRRKITRQERKVLRKYDITVVTERLLK